MIKAEIISVGTELTTGRNLDTNAQWLSQRLAELGVRVGWHTTVADDLADQTHVIRAACRRASLVVVTGGLGPTLDDLTREALAQAAGVDLVLDDASLEYIRGLFAERGREMPERNRIQAMSPRGAEAIPNPLGTAPGIWMKIGTACVAALPGVPSEMKRMFDEWVAPRLRQEGLTGGTVIVEKKINCFGAGESTIEEKLGDLTARGRRPEVGITASDATISLRIVAEAASAEEAESLIAPVEAEIRSRLGSLVFGEGDEELQHVVMRNLLERRLTVATAESLTAGLIAARLADVPGASRSLMGGVVAYDPRVKIEILGVPADLIERHGVVSEAVAEAMATGARDLLGTDYAVSATGVAGPTGGTKETPVGTVCAAVAWHGGVRVDRRIWPGNRSEVRSRAAKMAINLLRLVLLEEPIKPGA